MDIEVAQKTWEIENNVQDLTDDPQGHRLIYAFDHIAYETLVESQPWKSDPHYFNSVWISSIALIKMVIHARSGGNLEIMGLMQGKIIGNSFVIMDTFALPVVGTETRVNAGAEANEYMVKYQESSEKVKRNEPIVGWYHSHPGYGCWLSGIDVQTEMLYQQHQDPFIAVDPTRTCSAGRVELKAFRCYPLNYTPLHNEENEFQTIPANKIEDFGLHWKQYYSVPIQIFKSKLDEQALEFLWASHWTSTLIATSLIENTDYHLGVLEDLKTKIEKLERIAVKTGRHTARMKLLSSELRDCSLESKKAAMDFLRHLRTLLLTRETLTFFDTDKNDEEIHTILKRRLAACCNSQLF